MKLCVIFPNSNWEINSPLSTQIGSLLSNEGWNVVPVDYYENFYDDPYGIMKTFNVQLRPLINDKDTRTVMFVGIGYGSFWAHQMGALHAEGCVLIDPIMDPLSVFKLKPLAQQQYQELMRSYEQSGPIAALLTRESIKGTVDEQVLFDIGADIQLLGKDASLLDIAHHVEELSEHLLNSHPESVGANE